MPTPTPTMRRLPNSSSLLLDLVRFSAALMVAFGHLTQHYFSQGWRDSTGHAVEAVGVFFVLSGFVIRYVSRLKYGKIGEYWIDRASRIYSVLLPAIGFTLVVYWIAIRINPGYYLPNWGLFSNDLLARLALNVSLTSQLWSRTVNFLCNGPLWSISYEGIYYAIYGCAFYLRGALRWMTVLGLIALGGAHIALLFPLWLLGCVVYEIYVRLTLRRTGWRTHLSFAALAAAGVLLWRPVVAMIFGWKNGMTRFLLLHHLRPPNLHWMLDYYRVGIPAAFLMLWLLVAVHGLRVEARSRWVRSIRILAEGTFPLYVMHFPLYVLVASVIPYDHGNPVAKIAMLLAAIAFGVLLAFPTNRLRDAMRNRLRDWFLPGDRMPAARSAETVAS
jgi:peptidoglycan/LPS O-acetylase OafA/YrhL